MFTFPIILCINFQYVDLESFLLFLEIVLDYSFKILSTLNYFGFLALAIQLCMFFLLCLFPITNSFSLSFSFLMYLISIILSYLYSIPFIKFSFESIFAWESCSLALVLKQLCLFCHFISLVWWTVLSFFSYIFVSAFWISDSRWFSYFQGLLIYIINSSMLSCKLFLLYDYFWGRVYTGLIGVDSSFLIHIIICNRFLFPMDFLRI